MSTAQILRRLYSSDTSSPYLLRSLHSLIRRDEEEQYLASLQGFELAQLIDFLDKALSAIPITEDVAQRCVNKLQAMCGDHAIIPSSCMIVSGEIAIVGVVYGAIVDVWEGTYHGKKVSVKCLKICTEDYRTLKKSFSKEAVIWKRLKHPNVVPFIGVTTDPLQIVSEWMPNGALMKFVERNPGVNRIDLLLDVSEGLDYLHANNVIHGNLDGPSILIDHDGHARLTDFEFASIVRGMNSGIQMNGYTAAWAAPEILEGINTMTREADVFAFGMVVIEVFTGRPPFSGFATSAISSKIRSGERPPRPWEGPKFGLTDSMWDTTVRCWNQDPVQRPTMAEVVELLRELLMSSHSMEADLRDLFQVGKTLAKKVQGEKAQEFADRLDEILEDSDLDEQEHKEYLKYLQKLCGAFGVLPSSFTLPLEFIKRDAAPFIAGGYSTVYKATFHDHPVVIKDLKVGTRTEQEDLRRLLIKKVIRWKWLRHENILSFVGVIFEPSTSIVSERMDNGNIMDFIKANRDYNRLRLLIGAVTGLQYLHEQDIVHGDLKGANVLIDSECRARLADFELAAIVDEMTNETRPDYGQRSDTVQWMAPELLFHEGFGSILSKVTDIYATGMTILEVFTGRPPFSEFATSAISSKIRGGERPPRPWEGRRFGLTDSMWEMMVRCWHQDPVQRPAITEVVELLHKVLVSPHSIEADLRDFVQVGTTLDEDNGAKKVQEFADRLDETLEYLDLDDQKRKKYLKYLRKLCGAFDVLPSSFTLPLAFIKRDAAPFASGGYSKVYRATFDDRAVVVKILDVGLQTDQAKLHKLLVKEVVRWKWLQHENILPFVGVMLQPSISIVSERMDNGNIMEFIHAHQDYNRIRLLVGSVTGLEYLHEHDIIHGGLKGVNILIDSKCHARLADFGFAVVIDELTNRTTPTGGFRGTIRWMAPELLLPEEFGFSDGLEKKLPSEATDIYAMGMTILEVLTGRVPFATTIRDEAVVFQIIGGARPARPFAGLSDALWELLEDTWAAEHAKGPHGRPPANTVLHRLKGCVGDWGKSIVPL